MHGDLAKAEKLSDDLIALNKQISGTYSVAGVKAAMNVAGFQGGAPRRPLKTLSEDQVQGIRKAIQQSPFGPGKE